MRNGGKNQVVRYAVIGFGGIAENRIAREGFALDRRRFAPLQGAVLTGAWSRSDRRRKAAEELGLCWYESLESLLADERLDAVFIAGNNATHVPYALQALQAGKHVILEKPMGVTLEGAEAVTAAAAAAGLSLSVDHMMRRNGFNRKAREMLISGDCGAVQHAEFHIAGSFGRQPEERTTWRCADPEELGGPIGDIGSHCLYMAEYLLGSPIVRIAAVYEPKVLPMPVEDGALIRFELASGVRGVIRVAFGVSYGTPEEMQDQLGYEIYGTVGTLRGYGVLGQLSGHEDEPRPLRLELSRDGELLPIRPEHTENIYRQVIEEHAASIRNGNPLSGEEGVHNLRLCLAAHASARQGGVWIDVC